MSKQDFQVVKSTEYKLDDGTIKYSNKLVTKSVDELLGLENQLTLYVHGNKELPVGENISMNPNDYIIEDREYTLPEGATNAGEVIQLKTIVARKSA